MKKLDQVGMKKNWIYEIIISSYDGKLPNAAPFGVKTPDFNIVEIDMYKGSKTLKNILSNREFVINAVADPASFYEALYEKQNIKYGSADTVNAPLIIDAPINMEAVVESFTNTEQKVLIKASVSHIHIRQKVVLVNRANNLLLESLILTTRASHFPLEKTETRLKEHYRVVKKVAPGSIYQSIMQELLNKFFG
jgi:hypothetical protein